MKRVRLRGVAFAVAVLLVAGCSSGMGTVEGQVVWADGKPATELEGSQVAFESAELRTSARGVIGADGSFALTTTKPGDGAPVGDYRAMIVEHRKNANEAGTALMPEKMDIKFGDLKTSGLSATVNSGTNKVTLTVERAKK